MLLSACAIGPDYNRPQVIEPVQFKEAQGWRQANPKRVFVRQRHWCAAHAGRFTPALT